MTGDERSVAQGSTLAPCLPSWRRPPPGWLIASSRACRCATGCCRSRSHCAASSRCTLNCSPRYYRPFTGSLRRIGSGRRAANAVKWPPAPSPSSSASARRPIIAAIEEPALIERLLMQAWRCVRFRELGQAASGRSRYFNPLSSGRSTVFFASAGIADARTSASEISARRARRCVTSAVPWNQSFRMWCYERMNGCSWPVSDLRSKSVASGRSD